MMSWGTRVAALSAVIGCVVAPASAAAQGFALNENGTCAMGRADAAVAVPCDDGSSLFLNPAGLAGLQGWRLSAGGTFIWAFGKFADDFTARESDLQDPVVPTPHVYVAHGITDRLAAGIGLATPYGLETKWSTSFAGRFVGYDNRLQAFYVQPTVAYRPLPGIALGAGLDVAIGWVRLTQRLDLSQETLTVPGFGAVQLGALGIPRGTDFANARLTASGATGVGGNFGLLVDLGDRLRFGARYLTRITLDFDGHADFTPVSTGVVLPPQNPIALALGLDPTTPLPLDLLLPQLKLFEPGAPLADQSVRTRIVLPDQLTLGLGFQALPAVQLVLEWQWVHWSLFRRLNIDFSQPATPDQEIVQDFRDASDLRFGAEWAASRRWTLRGGYVRSGAAEPPQSVTPLLPESARNEITVGVGYALSDRLTADVAYMFLRQDHRRGRVTPVPSGVTPTENLNSGLYEFGANLLAVTLALRL